MTFMRTLLIVAIAAVAAPAAAQTFDPLAVHRFQMEQARVRTELQGLNASVHALQSQASRQQLRPATPMVTPVPEPAYVPASSPRCDPRTVTAENPCVVKPAPQPRRK